MPLRRPRLDAGHDGHVLNLGLNDTTVQGLVEQTGNARFAWDCYRRFVQMYGDVVLGCKPENDDEARPVRGAPRRR